MNEREPLRLKLKLEGPLVEEHRLPLSELNRVTTKLRSALRDVAIVLTEQGPSGHSGRTKKVLEEATDLRVVASPRAGSFLLELETPPQAPSDQPPMIEDQETLSDRCVEAFVEGLAALSDETEALPRGFDRGVIKAVVPFGTALKKGLTGITLSTNRNGEKQLLARIDREKVATARRLIKKPVKAHAVVEGMLQMVDFGALECRVDRPPLPSVICVFDESYRDAVQEAVRQFVRVTGEGEFEPEQAHPKKVWAESIQVLSEALPFDSRAFWQERSLEQIAASQVVHAYGLPEDIDEDEWRDDDEAAALISAIEDE